MLLQWHTAVPAELSACITDAAIAVCCVRAESAVVLKHKWVAAGIINGGIVSAIFDCHGNWSAAVALMDRACLPRPPLTLTRVMQVPTLVHMLLVGRQRPLSVCMGSVP